MSDPGVDGYIQKWLLAHPAQRVALAFLPAHQRDTRMAMAALEQELVDAAYAISEPGVAATKLNWWAEELAGATSSGGRHPLVKVLFADQAAGAIEPAAWLAPVTRALAQLDAPTPVDFATQLDTARGFHGALATLETRLWFGPQADPARAACMASLDHLLHGATRLRENAAAERLPLPMSCLARHRLDRDALGRDSPERRAALRDQLGDLRDNWQAAWQLAGPLSLFRGLDARLGQHWTRKAARARAPLATLRHGQHHQTGFTALRHAWAAARASRRARTVSP